MKKEDQERFEAFVHRAVRDAGFVAPELQPQWWADKLADAANFGKANMLAELVEEAEKGELPEGVDTIYRKGWADGAAAERAALLSQPELVDFQKGIVLEALHQRERWGQAHDRSKSAENWFWLVGYLAGKALRSAIQGDRDKAAHHTISSAAALSQWHAAILADTSGAGIGQDEDLRPREGIACPSCKARGQALVITRDVAAPDFLVARCLNCSAAWRYPEEDPEETGPALSPEDEARFNKVLDAFAHNFRPAPDEDHVWTCPKHGPHRSPACMACQAGL